MILLDTHTLVWMGDQTDAISATARELIADADRLAVAGITWYELAWLFDAGRIAVEEDPATWLRRTAGQHATLPATWSIGHRAAGLSRHEDFPKDPADRLIYATAVEHGLTLVTKDRALRRFDSDVCRW